MQTPNPSPPRPPALSRRLFLTGLALLAVVAFFVRQRQPRPPTGATDTSALHGEARQQFFQHDIEPLLARARGENRLSADHTRARLHATFARYRTGILPFAEDLHSLRTGLGVARRKLSGALGRGDGTEDLVREKFARHLFAPDMLLADLTGALSDLETEWEANRANLLADCRAAVARSDLPGRVSLLPLERVDREARRHLETFARGPGPSEAAQGAVRLLVSGLVDLTALRVSTTFATRLAGSVTARAAASAGGATAGGAVGGAAGGSSLGPAGTLAGLALGLAGGVVADWWMSESSTADLSDELHGMLSEMEARLLRDPQDGLEPELSRAVDRLAEADTRALRQLLLEEPTP